MSAVGKKKAKKSALLPTFASKKYSIRSRKKHLGASALIFLAVCAIVNVVKYSTPDNFLGGSSPKGRQLLNYAEYDGMCDTWLDTENRTVAMVLYLFGSLYMFWGLAIVCDDYFTASLEVISEELDLTEDVAGATFMAAGSSAPELFTSLMGVFAVESDVGTGTIIGSAVFNICCIIGGTAMFAGQILELDWRPLTRDCIFYFGSVCVMYAFMKDETVLLWEGCVLIGVYFLYIFVMVYNPRLMAWMASMAGQDTGDRAELRNDTGVPKLDGVGGDEDDDEVLNLPSPRQTPRQRMEAMKAEKEEEEEEEEEDGGFMDKLVEAISRPWEAILSWTIPTCDEDKTRKNYMACFLMSIAWIGISTFLMVLWVSKLGCMWEIHPAVMGVSVLAVGTSVPDGLASLAVAKDGQGDMAVSNAIGSNVFDICLGLGIPWALHYALFPDTIIHVDTSNLDQLIFLLAVFLFGCIFTIAMMGWKLNVTVGFIFFMFYFVFVGYSLAHEFGAIDF